MNSLSEFRVPDGDDAVAVLADRADNAEPDGDGFLADCPAHIGGNQHTLRIQPDGRGGVVLSCDDGCEPAMIRMELSDRQPMGIGEAASDSHGEEAPRGTTAAPGGTQIDVDPRDLLDVLERHPGLQTRADVRQDVVAEYAELIGDGVELPPVLAIRDDETDDLCCYDGWHRVRAYRQAERLVPVQVEDGTLDEALGRALAANATHGLRRSNADKQAAVERAFELMHSRGQNWSDPEIARRCGVSAEMVRLRRPIFQSLEDGATRTVTRKGQSYPVNTSRIGRATRPPLSGETSAAKRDDVAGRHADALEDEGNRDLSAVPSSTIQPGDLVPTARPADGPEQLRKNLSLALDRAAELPGIDPERVAAVVDAGFVAERIEPLIAEIQRWSIDLADAVARRAGGRPPATA